MFSALNTIPAGFTASYVKAGPEGFNDLMTAATESPIFYGSQYSTLVNKMTSAQTTVTKGAIDAMKSASN